MKRLRAIGAASLILMVLNGCAGYRLSGRDKTVTVDMISPRTFKVDFCGNAYMSQEEVEKYALQRASEAALSKGFSHFIVLNKRDDSEVCLLDTEKRYGQKTVGGTPEPSSSYMSDFKRPNVTLTIKCFYMSEDVPEDAFNAEEFLRNNFPGIIR